jgi:fucose permease
VSSGFEVSTAPELLANAAVLLSGFVWFCYIGLEVSAASWTTTYLKKAGFEEKQASVIFSLFWVAMMLGRFAASQAVTTEIGRVTIQIAAVAAALFILVMTLQTPRAVGAACVILLGLCFAPMFPTTVGLRFAKFQPHLYGSVFAIIFAIGLLGSSVVPAAIGAVSSRATIRRLPNHGWGSNCDTTRRKLNCPVSKLCRSSKRLPPFWSRTGSGLLSALGVTGTRL